MFEIDLGKLARFYPHPSKNSGAYGFGPVWSDWVGEESAARAEFENRLREYLQSGTKFQLVCPNDGSGLMWVSRGSDRQVLVSGNLPIQLFHCDTCHSVFRAESEGRLNEFPVDGNRRQP